VTQGAPIHGLIAEFHRPRELLAAVRRTRAAGYQHFDAYTPFPVEGLGEEMGMHRNWLPLIVLVGGIVGAIAGLGLQSWTAGVAYPTNVGGRPLFSWPAFIPITFETTVLFAAIAAVLGMLALNGLPRPYHPVFNAARFALASRDRFFLCIEATDPLFDQQDTRRFLEGLSAQEVSEVES